MSKRDVLLVAENDWANTGYRFSKCLRMLDLDVLMIKKFYHPFMYPEQAIVHPELRGLSSELPSVQSLVDSSKVLHFIASTVLGGVKLNGQKKVVQHGGSVYRQNANDMNKEFSDVDATIIQCPDLLGLGAKNESLIYYPVDTDMIKPTGNGGKKLRIGHFPSNPEVKGSDMIERLMRAMKIEYEFKYDFEYVGSRETVPWRDNLKRMGECDIIIECLNPQQGKAVYGEWGNTALEAAALGKIVITNSLKEDIYKQEYGHCELLIANSLNAMKNHLGLLLDGGININHKKEATRQWVVEKHSMKATAERLWNKVYKELV